MEIIEGTLGYKLDLRIWKRKYTDFLCCIFGHKIGHVDIEIRVRDDKGETDLCHTAITEFCSKCGELLNEWYITSNDKGLRGKVE